MDRAFSQYASRHAKNELARLLASRGDVSSYRAAMLALGRQLGRVIARMIDHDERVLVGCGVEDADYVAKGVVESLEDHVGTRRVRFACFWNSRTRIGSVEQAPIVRQYIERHARSIPHIVMVKSIISTSCAVHTNLAQLLDRVTPRTIYIAAPVIHRDAPFNLKREFDDETARKLRYVYFAKDSTRDGNRMIVPGVGGSVYELLGLGNAAEKNSTVPSLVAERRKTGDRPDATAAFLR